MQIIIAVLSFVFAELGGYVGLRKLTPEPTIPITQEK